MRVPLVVSLFAGLVFILPLRSLAQTGAPAAAVGSGAQVEVASVRFVPVRLSSAESWLETEVELDVKPGGKQLSGEFVDRVRLTLNLGFKAANAKGEERDTFYQASAEMISIEAGKVTVRFYLPPEIVRRDKIRGDAYYYLVELAVAGELQKPLLTNISKSIKPEFLSSFKSKISAEATVNDGILMPQYLTPFASDTRRPSPTFLRRETHR